MIPQAVILRRGIRGHEVLLLKRTSPRAWELPGGYLEPHENPAGGLRREVREETGLEVRLERLLGWYHRTGFRPHRSPIYVCTPAGGAVRLSHEAVAIDFFPITGLPLGLFPWYREIIRDAAAGVAHPAVHQQRLGIGAVVISTAIHLGELAGLLR